MQDIKIGNLVLYKNNQLIAFQKPAGLLVQPDKSKAKSLLELGEIYTKSKLHLIHRIDRPVSGVVLFAKTARALQVLNQQFADRQVNKNYLALVRKGTLDTTGELVHYIEKMSKVNKAIAHKTPQPNAKKGALTYQLIGASDHYSLLEVSLQSGRYHQIRAQLAAIGHPIKGDVKYGFKRSNPDRSISLHAWKLQFKHPVTNETTLIVAPPPAIAPWNSFALDF